MCGSARGHIERLLKPRALAEDNIQNAQAQCYGGATCYLRDCTLHTIDRAVAIVSVLLLLATARKLQISQFSLLAMI